MNVIVSLSGFLPFALSVATNVITLNYLGMSFDSTNVLDANDWKRKWILVLAYIQVISVSLMMVSLLGGLIAYLTTLIRQGFYRDLSNTAQILLWVSLFLLVIICVFSIITSVFTIIYLGPTFEKSSIEENDWKRKWIIFFAWFGLILQGIWLLILAFLPMIMVMANVDPSNNLGFY